MQFCKECENKLFAVEEELEENGIVQTKLVNKCLNCGSIEDYNESVISKKIYKNKSTISSENNKYLIYDPTIPRTKNKECPNKSCPSKNNKELQEAIFIQDALTIKLTFICVLCNTEWKYS